MDWSLLAGPAALAVAATLAVVALWRDHRADDKRRNDALALLTDAVPAIASALRDLTAVVKDVRTRR